MTYCVGNHHGVTIVREGDGARCDRPDHDCDRGHLVGVMLTAEDAALVVEALNRKAENFGRWCENETGERCCGLEALEDGAPSGQMSAPQTAETGPAVPASTPDGSDGAQSECGCPATYSRVRVVSHTRHCSDRQVVEGLLASMDFGEPADSCTAGHQCVSPAACWADPDCPVYSSRKQPGDSCTCPFGPEDAHFPDCPMAEDAPSARVISPQTAETGPVVPASTSDGSGAAETPPAACGRTNPHMPHAFGEMFDEECAGIPSPCACPPADGPRTMPDPLCPRHQRRKVRGPKPPDGDGSGRPFPRHGAVM